MAICSDRRKHNLDLDSGRHRPGRGGGAADHRLTFNYASLNPGGNDFLVHWMGTRSYITEGISPYSDEVALRIQNMVYGRPALPGEHELRVAIRCIRRHSFLPFAFNRDFTRGAGGLDDRS